MRRFAKKLKLKRVLAMFLLVSIVLTTFLTSMSINMNVVYADSNDRRSSLMNLSASSDENKTQFKSLDDVKNIDSNSLRVIALFLSNFYTPWSSVLDGDYDPEEELSSDDDKEEESKSKTEDVSDDFKASMTDALVKHCAFEKKTAGYIVDYIIQQNLATCQQIYMRTEDLKVLWDSVKYAAYLGDVNKDAKIEDIDEYGVTRSIGFYNRYAQGTNENVVGWGYDGNVELPDSNTFYYSDFETYKGYFGTISVESENNSKEYIAVTYPIFLSVMDYCYFVASNDTLEDGLLIKDNANSYDSYNISNRTDKVGNSKADKQARKKVSLMQFFVKKDDSMTPVFSNNEECMQSYAMIQNFVDIAKGYGSGFLALQKNDAFFSGNRKEKTDKITATAAGQLLYTNWIGDLIINTGRYRILIYPGCCNPYMLSTLNDTYYRATIPAQNLFAIAAQNQGYLRYESADVGEIVKYGTDKDEKVTNSGIGKGVQGGSGKKKVTTLYVNTKPNSTIFNKSKWNCFIGSKDELKMDENIWIGITDSDDDIKTSLESAKYNGSSVVGSAFALGKDPILFPSWSHIAVSPTYNNVEEEKEEHKVLGIGPTLYTTIETEAYFSSTVDELGITSSVESIDGGSTVARMGARDLYGHTVWNDQFAYYDSFEGITKNQNLGSFFKVARIIRDETPTELKNRASLTVDYGKVKEDTLINSYVNESSGTYDSLFTSIFLTYCLAFFNEEDDKTEVVNVFDDKGNFSQDLIDKAEDTNFIDLKTNFARFPSSTGDVDWTTIFSYSPQEEVLSFARLLLHPTEGIQYVANLVMNKLKGVLLQWHEDIVGATDSNSTTGMTKYLGFSGYTTVPSLGDIDWVAKILDMYNSLIVYLIIIVCLIMLCYVLTGSMTLQRGIIGVLMFSLLAFLPPFAINATVDASNKVSSSVYSSKFDYWALCQMQTYLEDYENALKARENNDMGSYTAFVLSNNAKSSNLVGGSTSNSYGGVKLKWMSPKKYSSMASLSTALDDSTKGTSATYLKSWIYNAIGNQTSGENFVDDNGGALYLYRDYTDIYRYASGSYNLFNTYNYNGALTVNSNKDNPLYAKQVNDAKRGRMVSVSPYAILYTNVKDEKDENTNYDDCSVVDNIDWWENKLFTNTESDNPDYTSINKKYDYISTLEDGSDVYDLGMRYSSGVRFLRAVESNVVVSKTTGEATAGDSDNNPLSASSSLQAIKSGFLYDTVDYKNKGERDKLSYYNSNSNTTVRTLATSLLLNYNKTWDICSKQYARLSDLVERNYTMSLDNITSVDGKLNIKEEAEGTDGYKQREKSRTMLLGLNLNTYATDDDGNGISGIQSLEGLRETDITDITEDKTNGAAASEVWTDLSNYYYGLYSESPFYFFNFNIRDQLLANKDLSYSFDPDEPGSSGKNDSDLNNVSKLLLNNNQEYFFNLADESGDGYGELRDFMNMHDFFYYILPCMEQGVKLARLYDDVYGFEADEDCAVSVNTSTGRLIYAGQEYSLRQFMNKFYTKEGEFTDEEKYKIWHTINTYSILNAYCPWLDAMMDCDYAEPETIRVMGEKFKVQNPLDPTSYFTTDAETRDGSITGGRYMVFSRSEMAYYGLKESDLTSVEKKIIEVQDNVYKTSIDLMNYYTMSDETLIQALSMLELFEFNKVFSQEKVTGSDYILYPQGYELKAFTYDAYLRLVVAQASGEDLMTSNTDDMGQTQANESIYSRIQANTSLFFAIFLLLNDLIAVYIIPGFKLFFVLLIFFSSILLILASAVKLELNMANVTWKSLIAPLLSFLGISIGMTFIVSMFMSNGASGVTQTGLIIDVGDPTMVVIIMLVINAIVTILYWKLVKKAFTDAKVYTKALANSIGGAVSGVAGKAVGAVTDSVSGIAGGGEGKAGIGRGGHNISSTADQRGRDNSPASGRDGVGVGSALAAGAGAYGMSEMMTNQERQEMRAARDRANASQGMNKWDKKAYDGANKNVDNAKDKYRQAKHDKEKAENSNSQIGSKLADARMRYSTWRYKNAKEHAADVQKYGAVRAKGKQIGRGLKSIKGAGSKGINTAKDAAGKAKSGATRLGRFTSENAKKAGNTIKQGAKNAKATLTNQQTYRNIGKGVATIGNKRRSAVRSVKKGASEMPGRVASGAKSVGRAAVNGARSASNAVANGARSASSAVANGARSASRAVASVPSNVSNSAKSAYTKGRAGLDRANNFRKRSVDSYKKGYATATDRNKRR